MQAKISNNLLSRAEVDFFVQNGYLGPYAAMSPDEMQPIREEIEATVLVKDGPNLKRRMQSRHMDQAVVYDLASHPTIVDRIAGLMGPDIVVWATNFWLKEPGSKEIPWHQDINFWPIEPPLNVSAWLAIDEVTEENACVRVIPGSHRQFLAAYDRRPEEMAFAEMADPAGYDDSGAVSMELQPGEFFLFSERLLHASSANTSDKRRLGLSVRVTIPMVHIFQDEVPLHKGHTAILARGQDVMGFNRYAGRPGG